MVVVKLSKLELLEGLPRALEQRLGFCYSLKGEEFSAILATGEGYTYHLESVSHTQKFEFNYVKSEVSHTSGLPDFLKLHSESIASSIPLK